MGSGAPSATVIDFEEGERSSLFSVDVCAHAVTLQAATNAASIHDRSAVIVKYHLALAVWSTVFLDLISLDAQPSLT
jgi:hypothetical protein